MAENLLPIARREGLLVREVEDEVLVYDQETHRAVCLNRAAALVWKHCDGKTDAKKLARLLSAEMDASLAEGAVWKALERLGRERLLTERVKRPQTSAPSLSRREMLRRVGYAAAASIPVVTSMLAPTPAQAASACKPTGAPCSASIECCSQVCAVNVCL